MAGRGIQHLPSMLQLVSPLEFQLSNFDSMEDIADFASFVANGSESISGDTAGDSISDSSTSNSISTPLLHSTSFTSGASSSTSPPIPGSVPTRKTSKRSPRSNLRCSVDYSTPAAVSNQAIASLKLLTRSKSFNGSSRKYANTSREQKQIPGVDEALPLSQPTTPFSDVSHSSPSPSSTPRSPKSTLRHSIRTDYNYRRKSLDLGSNMMQASIRRLKRSPSLWTAGDRYLPSNETRDRHLHDLRAEPRLSDEQKHVALRRARKIAQVFGSEAPTDLLQEGTNRITDHRDSLSTILSTDMLLPSTESVQRHSNSDPPTLLPEAQQLSTSLDTPELTSDIVSINTSESSSSLCASSSFSERRRRAAKLTHFFGVNYQDISRLIAEEMSPPLSKHKPRGANATVSIPVVEVDVKVAGRRFWGLADGEMKNANVADVIDQLRGLKAA